MAVVSLAGGATTAVTGGAIGVTGKGTDTMVRPSVDGAAEELAGLLLVLFSSFLTEEDHNFEGRCTLAGNMCVLGALASGMRLWLVSLWLFILKPFFIVVVFLCTIFTMGGGTALGL